MPRPPFPTALAAPTAFAPEPLTDHPLVDPLAVELLRQVPEFAPVYLDLVKGLDDDPGGPLLFTELADFVADRLDLLDSGQILLDRALAAVEMVASRGDEEAELIAYAFLDSLSPEDRRLILPWLGTATRALLDDLDSVGGEES